MSTRRFTLAWLLAWLPASLPIAAPALASSDGEVRVTVDGIPDARGQVLVALCGQTEFLHASCVHHGRTPSAPGKVIVTLHGVPPGIYAAQAFQDTDGNGRVTRSLLGLPKEPMGFSNDAPMRFGPPAFDAAAIRIGPAGGTVSVNLRRY